MIAEQQETRIGTDQAMNSRWLTAIVTLPLPVVVLIPTVLLFAFRGSRWAHSLLSLADLSLWLAAVVGALGLTLAIWSVSVFGRHAEGTPAPWDPPTRFIARGPYRYIRNPMILGVICILLAESLILRSWPLLGWFLLFTIGNMLYIPLVEEKGLARRFGETYLEYKQNVPRWLPRRTDR
jgi:protein-S-isoprenylcysteine O-methyltransferase Ste14